MRRQPNLQREISRILKDAHVPIVAGENWAARSRDLAAGLAGLRITVDDIFYRNINLVVHDACRDIFTSHVAENENINASIEFRNSPHFKVTEKLGDLFEGSCNLVWTDLVFARQSIQKLVNAETGQVTRPGLGHGELIRDFTLWYSGNKFSRPKFETSDDDFELFGWCNGKAGYLVIMTLASILGNSLPQKELLSLVDLLISELELETAASGGFSLCHGFSGAMAAALGTSRLLESEIRISKLQTLYATKFSSLDLANISNELTVDCSWLTGVSGLLWIEKSMSKIPLVNPIVPFDSLLFRKNMAVIKSL